ncbi:MAG TPA: patatin-like phospholipase family protein [Chryseosolibacter sp.]|nr:patatin-like phospholipase family protein [Chryseosolibacter sp.]
MRKLTRLFNSFAYSFPVQLLLNNLKRNHVMMLCWVVLFAAITGAFGKYLGVPYLFLDPEYLSRVSFRSFFIIGLCTAGLTTAFHITSYINDGHRFSFIGTLSRPFTRFAINNSVVPVLFLTVYIYEIVRFQINNEYVTGTDLVKYLGGLLSGFVVMTLLFFVYFRFTNKDIFRYVVCQIDEKIKHNVKVTRASAMKKLDIARKKQIRVDNYLDYDLKFRRVERNRFYDRATILQVFDQNHFNLVIIELMIFVLVLILGVFKDYPVFQLPAASSILILMTIFVMMAGAFSYWFGNWSATSALILFLLFNHLVGKDIFTKRYEAFGLDYHKNPIEYSVASLKRMNDTTLIKKDHEVTFTMLNNWRKKFGEEKPKMVFLCASGGGKRAALWTFTCLQTADSLTGGELFKHSILITGASGGLIGASYYRELKLRDALADTVNPYSLQHRAKISTDNLNPMIFSLLANDLFVGFSKFTYAGNLYERDRGYTFEEQLNQITEGMMDKPISAYDTFERKAVIPMMMLAPTIVNDGRKLYIGSRPVGFMNYELTNFPEYDQKKMSGVDFQRLFENQGGKDLRFLSALRMCATFPYITPNTALPTDPAIYIMDAGISDNFGLNDAARFLYAYKDWIAENTSGVVLVSIRDSPKLATIPKREGQTIIDAFTQPISSVYNNFEHFQDITSDMVIGYSKSWFNNEVHRVDIEYEAEDYVPILQKMDSIRKHNARASLSWRLTTREKQSIIENAASPKNMQAIARLKELLQSN